MIQVTRPDGGKEEPMNKKHASEVARALTLLGCEGVNVLNPAPKSFHVSVTGGPSGRLYLVDVYDAQKAIIELSRMQVKR